MGYYNWLCRKDLCIRKMAYERPLQKLNPFLSHKRIGPGPEVMCKSSDHPFKCLMVKIMNTNIHTHCSWCSRPILNVMYEFLNITISWGKYHHLAHFEENEVSLNNLLQVMQSLLSGRTSVSRYYIMLRNLDVCPGFVINPGCQDTQMYSICVRWANVKICIHKVLYHESYCINYCHFITWASYL